MKELLAVLVLTAATVVFVLGLMYTIDGNRCKQRAEMMGLECHYSILTDCMVKTASGWLPMEQLREFN